MDTLTPTQFLESGLDDWRQLSSGIHARFRTRSFTAGMDFLSKVTEAAEAANHHPDVTLTYPHVDLKLISHDVGALTSRDVELARAISDIAREQGLTAQPQALAELDLALDTADRSAAGPFWAAVLTGAAGNVKGEYVVDPRGRVPLLWFQQTDPHETPRQRFHLDVWVPHDQAKSRIAAALAAGGTVVDDSRAPAFTVLADGEGNHACISTVLGR